MTTASSGARFVVIDSPALTEPESRAVLEVADGVLLTSLADALCLRTLSAATRAVSAAMRSSARLRLLGLLLTQFEESDSLQVAIRGEIQRQHHDLLLATLPCREPLRTWPMRPGSPLPAARDEFFTLARMLEPQPRSEVVIQRPSPAHLP